MQYKIVTTKNIVSLSSGFQESKQRGPGIPRMGLIHAPTGFGKTTAAAWLVNRETHILHQNYISSWINSNFKFKEASSSRLRSISSNNWLKTI